MDDIEKQLKRWKSKTLGSCRDATAKVLQELRRREESDSEGFCACVTCGKVSKWNDKMQGGHYISRRHSSTCLLSLNIWPQCIRCNQILNGNLGQYRLFLGDRLATKLENLSRVNYQFTRYGLAKRIVNFRRRIEWLR